MRGGVVRPLIEYQHKAGDWLEWACGYDHQVLTTDPTYQTVVEHRDAPTKGYSSCGDLAHWMYARLGIRLPWVNRTELGHYRVGRNVSALCWPPAPARDHDPSDQFQSGDVVVIWSLPSTSDSHVVCVIDHIRDQRVLLTAEYGQKTTSLAPSVGGALRNHLYTTTPEGFIRIGRRRIRKVLRLNDVLLAADAAGALLEPEEPPAPRARP